MAKTPPVMAGVKQITKITGGGEEKGGKAIGLRCREEMHAHARALQRLSISESVAKRSAAQSVISISHAPAEAALAFKRIRRNHRRRFVEWIEGHRISSPSLRISPGSQK